MRLFRFCSAALPKAILFVAAAWSANSVQAQPTLSARPLAPLNTVKVPMPSNLDDFVRNREAAVALGKALFWDMQAGSDGMTACATCHWHAGADARIQNTLGLPKVNPHDTTLRSAISKLTTGDFPFVKVDDPNSNDIWSAPMPSWLRTAKKSSAAQARSLFHRLNAGQVQKLERQRLVVGLRRLGPHCFQGRVVGIA